MTFRATNQVTADAYASIKRQAAATRQYCQQQATAMQAATTSADVPFAVIQHFAVVIPMFDGWAATPGIASYAQAQENDPAYDVAAEYTAMRSAMVSARDQLISMFPKDANGFLLYQTMNAGGVVSARTFTAAQLAPVVTLLNNVAATIS